MKFNKILTLIVLILALLVGCSAQGSDKQLASRIQCTYRSTELGPDICVLRDTETGYEYMYVGIGYGGGIVRLDKKGEAE